MNKITISQSEMTSVSKLIKYATKYNLLVEVLWSALKFSKENPDSELEDICEMALDDWDI